MGVRTGSALQRGSAGGDPAHGFAATVSVLPTREKRYGVTYREDMPRVRQAIRDMKRPGLYPAEHGRN